MKYNITLFIGGLTGGGAERVCCNLANYLGNCGHYVEVVTMSAGKDTYGLNRTIKRIALLQNCERRNSLSNLMIRMRRLEQYLTRSKTDCYIVFLPINIIMLMLLKKKTSAKIIISERNDPSKYSFIMKRMLIACAKKADGIVFQTSSALKWYKERGTIRSFAIIPNAVNDIKSVKAKEQFEKGKIVAVGRLEKQKNYFLLINAFEKILYEYPQSNLFIYGEGKERKKINRMICIKNLQNAVHLMGYKEDVWDEISNANIYVSTSNYEGMQNSLIEAMTFGLPCIATDCDGGSARELIQNGYNGLLTRKNNEEDLIVAIKRILENEQMAQELGKNASVIKKKLDPTRIYGMWEQFVCSNIEKE
ncbi:MAG: glycosyltransferase [Lachnospiraceae bacterium]